MKLFVLIWGCYDDYEICGVTDDPAKAEAWVAQDDDHNGSIEFILNAEPAKVTHILCPNKD